MEKRERVAIGIILTAAVGVSAALLVAYRLGWVSLSQIVGYILEGIVLAGGLSIIAWAATWGFGPRIKRLFGSLGGPIEPSPQIPRVLVQMPAPKVGLSEDKKLLLFEQIS
jgi:hypothetical protein